MRECGCVWVGGDGGGVQVWFSRWLWNRMIGEKLQMAMVCICVPSYTPLFL